MEVPAEDLLAITDMEPPTDMGGAEQELFYLDLQLVHQDGQDVLDGGSENYQVVDNQLPENDQAAMNHHEFLRYQEIANNCQQLGEHQPYDLVTSELSDTTSGWMSMADVGTSSSVTTKRSCPGTAEKVAKMPKYMMNADDPNYTTEEKKAIRNAQNARRIREDKKKTMIIVQEENEKLKKELCQKNIQICKQDTIMKEKEKRHQTCLREKERQYQRELEAKDEEIERYKMTIDKVKSLLKSPQDNIN